MEAFQAHGENVVSFQLALVDMWWYIWGCYLAPDEAPGKHPRGTALLLIGDFNTDLVAPEVQDQDEVIVAALADECLEYMSGHFLPWHKPWLKDGCTWAMHRGSWLVRSQMNYILGTDSFLFHNIVVHNARHNVLGCLCGAEPSAHLRYLGKRTRFHIRPQTTPDKEDCMFYELWRAIPRPPQRERHSQSWISTETWSLIDTRM